MSTVVHLSCTKALRCVLIENLQHRTLLKKVADGNSKEELLEKEKQ